MQDIRYWAGFFDGEGSVSITKNLTVSVAIAQKSRAILDLCVEEFGGKVYDKKNKIFSGYMWKINGSRPIQGFLRAILPFSVVKKRDIEIGLEVAARIRPDNLGCNPLTEQERMARTILREELLSFRSPKKRGMTGASLEKQYRDGIKEKFNHCCAICKTDIKDKPMTHQIISHDTLYCRKCHPSRFTYEVNPISKERLEAALDGHSVDEACASLGISRASLYKKRKKFGLSMRRVASLHVT